MSHPKPVAECEHKTFFADCIVVRHPDDSNLKKMVGYTLEVKVKCADCGLPFEFKGLPRGSAPFQPTVSFDNTELRAPLRPSRDPAEQAKALLNQNTDSNGNR